MASTTCITVTLPSEQVEELREPTDDISGYVSEAVARQIRHQLLGEDLRRHQEEHGAFSEAELAEARALALGTNSDDDSDGDASESHVAAHAPPASFVARGRVQGARLPWFRLGPVRASDSRTANYRSPQAC